MKVNELSSFSKAAEELGYTQSNISSHINQLEKEFNHPLFERFGKNIYLTEYGRTFLPYAYEIINSVEQAKLSISSDIWTKALEHEEQICVISAPTHSAKTTQSLDISCLQDSNFIFTEQNCSYRIAFENILKANNIRYHIFMEIGNTEIIKKFVNTGLCLSILPRFAIKRDVEKNDLKILSITISIHPLLSFYYFKKRN